ncbi:hypothetical protein RhiirA5_365361 [Rhizophagus irregularis]|uniref:Uncharacterized protein n=2 Tax=Rhizophagus irregularis TaxID=588596 RepID=A0A015IYT0_RHIIW|nr:hypothetical protein RirG_161710 [Rhizophagus irregularis DAOM 197198w]EXX62443.1 hypothetical protein RirG_161710 [Rhizophagus irregularis DAOM 197198w]PKC00904.1 hypothetical protein RhiirA5_365361 [Rhizophagus irregularis]
MRKGSDIYLFTKNVVDFETFNKLKEFSSKVQNLEEEINSKLIKLKHNITTSSTITTTTSSNSTSSTTTTDTTTASTSSNSTSSTSTPITTNNKSKKIHTDIDKLTKNIVDLVENIMPPTFLQSYHLQYKLHKVVLYEYNKYIDEVYVSVNNISNRLSTSDNYSYVKNKERKSKNLFPSFKNKLNDILLKYADKFGFVDYQEQYHPEASSSSSSSQQNKANLIIY